MYSDVNFTTLYHDQIIRNGNRKKMTVSTGDKTDCIIFRFYKLPVTLNAKFFQVT